MARRAGFLAGAVLSLFFARALLAQGSLSPPAAPTPTMKTLDQLDTHIGSAGEQRTAVNSSNTPGDSNNSFIINQPGSYYLADNISGASGKHGISIQSDDVTLDLNGFILGTTGSTTHNGIEIPNAQSNITIRHGTMSKWKNGINGSTTTHTRLENVRLTNNTANGCNLGVGTFVKGCLSVNNATNGIQVHDNSSIIDCVSRVSGAVGFLANGNGNNIQGCVADANTGIGISVGTGCAVTNSTAQFNQSGGIAAAGACTIAHCTVDQNSIYGITPGNSSTITNCTVTRSQLDGISNGFGAGDVVINSTLNSNGANGASLGQGCRVIGSTISFNTSGGLFLGNQSSLQNSTVVANGGDGVDLESADECVNNNISGNGGDGIQAIGGSFGYGNRIDGNQVRDNTGGGIVVDQANAHNLIVRNSAGNNSGAGDYNIASGNKVGPTVTDPSAANANAWANFVDP